MASTTVNKMSNSKSNSNMEEFSKEIHLAIASFLGVNDVVNYQSCTKQLRKMIHLHRLNRPSPISIKNGSKSQSYRCRIHVKTIIGSPFYFSNLIHSVKLSCYYRDQGWGNRKGQIFITEKSNQELQQSERITAESPLAEHHETKCELIFKPKPGFMYCLCYRIGDGGGHTLIVRDIKLESFVHSACIPLANILMDTRPTSQLDRINKKTSTQSLFYRNMLQYVLDTVVYFDNSKTHCQQQQQQQQEILLGRRPSLPFFQSVGLNLMDEHDVEAVRILLAELESN